MSGIHVHSAGGSTRESLELAETDTVSFAGVIAENGTTPAEIAVFATKNGANQERLRVRGQAGAAFRVTSDAAGTGVIRPIEVEMGTTVMLTISAGGNLTVLGYVLGSNVAASSAGEIYWASRARLSSPAGDTVRVSSVTLTGPARVIVDGMYVDASNYERLRIYGQTGGAFRIASENAGSGGARAIEFLTGNVSRMTVLADGGILVPGLITATAFFDGGAFYVSGGQIGLRDSLGIRWSVNSSAHSGVYDAAIFKLSPGVLAIGNGSGFDTSGSTVQAALNLVPATAPSAPASGWKLFTDSGDGNKLKAIASNGTIITIGTP